MTDILKISLLEAIKLMRSKKISSVELTQEFLKNIENSKNNAFITICKESALKQAENADKDDLNGELNGIPLAIKDLFCTKGIKTTAASKILEDFIPPYESDVTQKLWNQGAILLGKTNMDEFAMGSTSKNSYFGSVINNWKSKINPNEDLVPGGSSGGSAVSVSAGLSIAATGSDTGGSIRQPASFCGVVGAKPSYGVCSRYGMIAYASSLDQAGVFTKTVKDAAFLMEIISGNTGNDSMMYKKQSYDFTSMIDGDINGIKIGIPKEFRSDHIHPDIIKKWDEAVRYFEKKGAIVKEISLPHADKSINVYYVITPAEASSNLARYDGVRYGFRSSSNIKDINELYEMTRRDGFGEEVRRRILIGTYVLSSKSYNDQYVKAMKVRRLIKNEFDSVFNEVDAILCPTTPNFAFPINQKEENPVLTYLNDIYTVPVNIAGLPGISVPCGLSEKEGLPIGLQIVTNRLKDNLMYKIADVLELGFR